MVFFILGSSRLGILIWWRPGAVSARVVRASGCILILQSPTHQIILKATLIMIIHFLAGNPHIVSWDGYSSPHISVFNSVRIILSRLKICTGLYPEPALRRQHEGVLAYIYFLGWLSLLWGLPSRMELLVLRHVYEDIKTAVAKTLATNPMFLNSGIAGVFIKHLYCTSTAQLWKGDLRCICPY